MLTRLDIKVTFISTSLKPNRDVTSAISPDRNTDKKQNYELVSISLIFLDSTISETIYYLSFSSVFSIILFFLNFYCYSITVVCLFSPSLHPTPAEPTSLPHLHPPPWFCPCVLYSSSCNPLSSLSPPHSPLAIVRLFLTSMSLVIFCFLFSSIYYVPVKGEIIWYLSLTVYLFHLT